ncbi:MAG: hypothetical protein EHM41_10680 [Chloroflexi bacterium]|nr:MAG: hypothetical protein EHM41_10680 [Chloroflexota bacterium]
MKADRRPLTAYRIFRHPDFPLALLLLAALVTGLLVFQDYGLSWDEPLFYAYGDAVGYAYRPAEWFGGSFDVNNAFGPSSDHRYYGPAYLLVARVGVGILKAFLTLPAFNLWRLVNFFTFLTGAGLLYFLAKRWMSRSSALFCTLLWLTQPVLWEHGFINPKDIPFTVFMMASILAGFHMVNRLSGLQPDTTLSSRDIIEKRKINHRRWLVFGILLAVPVLLLLVLTAFFQEAISGVVSSAYHADTNSFLGTAFKAIASRSGSIGEDLYIAKALANYQRLRLLFLAAAVPTGLFAFAVALQPRPIIRFWNTMDARFGPMPTLPAVRIPSESLLRLLAIVLPAAILLGMTTSIRVLGPMAGLLVVLTFLFNSERRSWTGMFLYGLIAILVMVITWPFLWDSPLARFVEVFQHMSRNPAIFTVLYDSQLILSDQLPASYLPVMQLITLTEPVPVLFLVGLVAFLYRVWKRLVDWRSFVPILLWFLIPLAYVMILRPPVYDGYRHFLFMLPPVFILAGLAFQTFLDLVRPTWIHLVLAVALLVPGFSGLISSHPYQYSYYNSFVGGVGGAFRRFETDYWLTCYKEVMQQVNADLEAGILTNPLDLYVMRQPAIAKEYSTPGINIQRFDDVNDTSTPGSLLLFTTRANTDLRFYPDAPVIYSVDRDGAKFCVIKQRP